MDLSKNELSIHSVPVLEDNIIWIWTIGNDAVVVDPAISESIADWLKNRKLSLKAILQTHHHKDHIGGTPGLLKHWPTAEVIASKDDLERIPFQTISVKEGDKIKIMGEIINILEVPAHTKNHIAFFINNEKVQDKIPVLFCGDTLFAAGCGRLFEGSPKDMFNSLNKFKNLPPLTKVYCAHEYTENNLRWAYYLRPNDALIKKRLIEVSSKREKGIITLPTSIKEEMETNLFLQAKDFTQLASLRESKDNWAG